MSRLLSETYTGTAWYIYAVVSRSFSVFYNVGEACELQNSTSQILLESYYPSTATANQFTYHTRCNATVSNE